MYERNVFVPNSQQPATGPQPLTSYPQPHITLLLITTLPCTGQTTGVSIPGGDKRFVSSPKRPYRISVLTILLFHGYEKFFHGGGIGGCVKLTKHLNPSPRLRKNGVVTLLPPYAFMACIMKFYFSSHLRLGLPSGLFCPYQIGTFAVVTMTEQAGKRFLWCSPLPI